MERVSSVIVGGIGRDCDEKVIRASLAKFDPIVDIFIPTKFGVSRGFAFVRFKYARDAEQLLRLNPEFCIEGRRLLLARLKVLPVLGLRRRLGMSVSLGFLVMLILSARNPCMLLANLCMLLVIPLPKVVMPRW